MEYILLTFGLMHFIAKMMQSNPPTGTGRVTRLLLPTYPKADYTLLDMSRDRLDIAKAHIEDIWEGAIISQIDFLGDQHEGHYNFPGNHH